MTGTPLDAATAALRSQAWATPPAVARLQLGRKVRGV